jgi:Beta-propeller repeat
VLKIAPSADSSGARSVPAVAEIKLPKANPASRIEALDHLPAEVNYFIGNDPAKWRTNVPTFKRIKYSEIYPGIDLVASGRARSLSLRFVAHPGADVGAIRVRVEGTARVVPGSGSRLALAAGGSGAKFFIERPTVDLGGGRGAVPLEHYQVALAQDGATTDPNDNGTVNIVNNPQLVYSTLLCGTDTGGAEIGGQETGRDIAGAIAVDGQGLIYVSGGTESVDFPLTPNAFQSTDHGATRGLPNAFVTVLDPSQPPDAQLIYSTYLGGSGQDCTGKTCGNDRGDSAIAALGPSGLIYLAGATYSADFPVTSGALQTVNRAFGGNKNAANLWGPSNAFFAVLDRNAPPSQQLVYSTYLGGTGGELGQSLAVDSAGLAYIGGVTASTDFPVTPNAFQRTNRGFKGRNPNNYSSNGFLSIIDPTKSGQDSLKYSTYFGGSFVKKLGSGDAVSSLAMGPKGRVYLTGEATSVDFPITRSTAFQKALRTVPHHPKLWVEHGFVAVLDPSKPARRQLVYSTYLGGTNIDGPHAIALDRKGFVYVAGSTCMNGVEKTDDFPTTSSAFLRSFPHPETDGCRAFLSKLDLRKRGKGELAYSTYLGGGLPQVVNGFVLDTGDDAFALAVDARGLAYLVGRTFDSNFPVTPTALQPTGAGAPNVFVSVLDPSAKGRASLLYSTYLGGRFDEPTVGAITLLPRGILYLAGFTGAVNWPVTANAFEQARPIPSATPSGYDAISCGFAAAISAILPTPTPTATRTPRARVTPTPR